MNRMSSTRLSTVVGQLLAPSAVALSLATSVAELPAQQQTNGAPLADAKKAADSAKSAANGQVEKVKKLLANAEANRKAGKYDAALAQVAEALAIDGQNQKARSLKLGIEADQKAAAAKKVEASVRQRIKAAEAAVKANNFDLARRSEAEAREIAGGAFKRDLDKLAALITEAESEAAQQKNATQIRSLLSQANAQLESNQFDAARETTGRVLQLDRSNRRANRLLAKITEEQKEFEANRAEREAEAALKSAAQLQKAGKHAEAEAAYREILQKSPRNKAAQRGLETTKKALAGANEAKAKSLVAEVNAALAKKDTATAEAKLAEARTLAPASADVRRADAAVKKALAPAAASVAAAKKPEVKKEMEAKKDEAKKEVAKATEAPKAEPAKVEAPKVEEVKKVEEKVAEVAKAPEAEVAKVTQEVKAVEPTPEAPKAIEPVPAQSSSPFETTPTVTPDAAKPAASSAAPAAAGESPFLEPANTTPAPTPVAQAPAATPAAPAVAGNAAASPFDEPAKPAATPAAPKPTPAAKETSAEKKAKEAEREQARQTAQLQAERRQRAENAYEEGVTLYRQGELARARQRWLDSKEIDPTFQKADSYLKNTEAEYNEFLAKRAAQEDFEGREATATEKMETLITFSTLEPTNLSDFLNTLRLFSGINFVILGEVKAKVEAAYDNQPLQKVLDQTLLPLGLRWEREPGTDTVRIMPDLRTEVFTVLPDQLNTIETLIREGVVPRLLYGPAGTPALQGQEIMTDPRQNIVVVTDSEANLTKFRRFVEGIRQTTGTQLIFKSFEIDETKAPQIKGLLDAILATDNSAPYNPETKLILEGGTLIIKDTPENIQKVEQILQDQSFMKNFYSDKLSVATFNLTPIIEFDDNRDLVAAFADQVRQVVETLLYAREGKSKAEREGRRLWYDPATLQLTVTDYPDRIAAVQDYIESLPQIRSRKRQKIVFLDWADASSLVSDIEAFLGIDAAEATGGGGGDSVTKTLSVNGQLEFRGATFRVTRVNENDAADENDDSVELVIRTGTTSQDSTIEEFRSEFVEDFEIVAEDVKPSNTPGEGRARLTINYIPGGQGGTSDSGTGEGTEDAATAADQRAALREETGLSIVPIENLNAIFVQYDNVEQLRDVEYWIETLDIPTLQVSLEIKFVEVSTSKSKEWKPEFVVGDLTDISISEDVLRSRFANDRDEYEAPFDPLNESQDAANLLKGTTVLNYIVSSGNSPISFTLRMLEAQGIINVVNGPTVTVLNKETADFEIERQFGIRQPVAGSTSSSSGDDQLTAVASITPVQLSVSPTVTRQGNITLDVEDLEVQDFDQNLGQLITLGATTTGEGEEATASGDDPAAYVNSGFGVLRKTLTTRARIKDGGTVVLGGWKNERTQDLESGIPILSDIPFIGPLLFNRTQKDENKITLLIFLTGTVVRD
jgi:type II secretory pathway component GspD/PulD (secretin)